MKRFFAISDLFMITAIAFLTFISPAVCGQGNITTNAGGATVYIPPGCAGKTISKMSRAEMLTQTLTDVKPNRPVSQSDQLKLFNELAKIINEVYLYPDFRGLDWPGIVTEFRNKIETGLETDKFYALMGEFIDKLGDKHSSFESPVKVAAVEAQLKGQNKFVGIGALFQLMAKSKQVTILAVLPGSPAEYSGLHQHDVVLEVDSLPLVKNDTVYPYTRGRECTMATLIVKSPGKEPRKVTVVRAGVTAPMPVYARLVPTTDGRRIGYIFLPTFLDLTIPEQVKKALEDFGQLDALVLDNRMNGGGSGKVLISLLSYFTSGTMGHFISRTGQRPLDIVAAPIKNSQKVPLVILVSNNTVSYGEVFAGALQDIGRAKLVGQTTSGRVETLRGYNLSDGSRAWIANERFDPVRSHINWEGRGVRPDAEVIAEWDQFNFESDPALVVALKLLRRQ